MYQNWEEPAQQCQHLHRPGFTHLQQHVQIFLQHLAQQQDDFFDSGGILKGRPEKFCTCQIIKRMK